VANIILLFSDNLEFIFWAIFHLFCELMLKSRHKSIELFLLYHNMTQCLKEIPLNWIPWGKNANSRLWEKYKIVFSTPQILVIF
jgi:hypothetical protein